MRVLGLDVGDARIGVALSDEGVLARPLLVIRRRSKPEDFAAIGRIVSERDVDLVVVGLPTSVEGEAGAQARRIRNYARELARKLIVPIVFVDESYSTIDAMDAMQAAGRRRRHRREQIDAAAAAVILQSYLNSPDWLARSAGQSPAVHLGE